MEIVQIKSKFLEGSFNQNTYVVLGKFDAIIIDAGAEVEDIKKVTKERKVLAVLLTHAHFDHVYNLREIIDSFNCDVYMCEGAENIMKNGEKNASVIIGSEMEFNVPNKCIKYYTDKIEIGEFKVEVIKTPGHSVDSVCLLVGSNLFTGDTVFAEGTGRVDLYGGSYNELIQSLKKILNLDFLVAYPSHFESVSNSQIQHNISFYI